MHNEFFQRKYEQYCLWKYIGGQDARVEENLKNEVLMLMDYHPVYKSLNSLKFYKEKGIKVINFPPYSPDLNPIENIWGKIKKQLMKKSIRLWLY